MQQALLHNKAPRSSQGACTEKSTRTGRPRQPGLYGVGVAADRSPRAGNTLLYVSLVLFAIGLVAIVAIFVIGVFAHTDPGLALYLTALAAPLGLLLALVFALRSGRRAGG